MIPRILRWTYQLRCHRFMGWAMERWPSALLLGAAAWIVGRWLLRSRPSLPAWHWLALALLITLTIGVLWLRRWAARRTYILFEPQTDLPQPAGQALDPAEKLLIRATGRFEVGSKSHFFADLLGYWRTFSTREHAVMAIVHPSRFLWLGAMPEEDLGMWYIFFQPQDIESVTPGLLTYGATTRPALCVRYRAIPAAPPGRKQAAKPVPRVAYLTFDDEPSRRTAWADLLAN